MNFHYIIDSRSLTNPQDTCFVALKTPAANGHNFVGSLFEKGVRHFLISEPVENRKQMEEAGATFEKCRDTLDALRFKAASSIDAMKTPVIAITGSRGKSVVKEWIHVLLDGKTRRSPRSYNSQIGVPLSILNLSNTDEPVVLEVGVSRSGEMKRMRQMIHPEFVVLTNVTAEHSEGFSDRQQQIAEKISLASQASVLIFPLSDEEILSAAIDLKGKNGNKTRLLGWEVSDEEGLIYEVVDNNNRRLKEKIHFRDYSSFIRETRHIYDRENLMSAIAVVYSLYPSNVNERLNRNIRGIHPIRTRLKVMEGKNDSKIIVDQFTSDSLSLAPALDFSRRISAKGEKRVLIVNNLYDSYPPIPKKDLQQLVAIADSFGFDRSLVLDRKLADIDFADTEVFGSVDELFGALPDNFLTGTTILIHSPEDNEALRRIIGEFEAQQHQTVLKINLEALIANYNFFRSRIRQSTGMICMLKAFGYGTGSVEIAKALEVQGASYLAVAVVDEGIELRKHKIQSPVIILNPRNNNMDSMIENRLEPTIYDFSVLEEICNHLSRKNIKNYPVHIKFETGMRRIGFVEDDIPVLAKRLIDYADNIKVATVFSHLATADCPDLDDDTFRQISLFTGMVEKLRSKIGYNFRRHILNSAGIIRFPQAQMDLVRLGIGLYGIPTVDLPEGAVLRSVAALYTTVISIKRWGKGEKIGYGGKGVLKRDSIIATLPIGYADGIDRRLGNGKGYMIVGGMKCPTVGNICMDICMIDVTDVPRCFIGSEVEVFGPNLPVERLAQWLDTIPYEILTSVSHRVKRVYYSE